MKKFWVDYQASIQIEAETVEEAEDIFYQVYADDTRRYARVNDIEEAEGDK